MKNVSYLLQQTHITPIPICLDMTSTYLIKTLVIINSTARYTFLKHEMYATAILGAILVCAFQL